MSVAAFRGAYTADRAAALSGVPRSTIHYWARHDVLVPSVSEVRVKLWSYADLMGLRTIYWLRRGKISRVGWDIPPSTMPAVRRALAALRELNLDLWTEDKGPRVIVDPHGAIYVNLGDAGIENLQRQRPLNPDLFDLIAPFETGLLRGPDLYTPRPNLRIVPGKLSGSPHLAHTRIETIAVASLARRGFGSAQIECLYPHARPIALAEALDLERQLSANLGVAA